MEMLLKALVLPLTAQGHLRDPTLNRTGKTDGDEN